MFEIFLSVTAETVCKPPEVDNIHVLCACVYWLNMLPLTCVNSSMVLLRLSMSWVYCSLRASISLSWHSTSSFSAPFRAVSSRSRRRRVSSWRWRSMVASARSACRVITSCREQVRRDQVWLCVILCIVCVRVFTVCSEPGWNEASETLLSSSWSSASWSSSRRRRDSAASLDMDSMANLHTCIHTYVCGCLIFNQVFVSKMSV